MRAAYESASDDGHDAFVLLWRLQSLERRVVKAAEMQQVKDPVPQQLVSRRGGGNLSLTDFTEVRYCALIIWNHQRPFSRPSGLDLAEHGLLDAGTTTLISILKGASGNAAHKASSVGILTPLARHGNVTPLSGAKRSP
jgi:hypothetical protein